MNACLAPLMGVLAFEDVCLDARSAQAFIIPALIVASSVIIGAIIIRTGPRKD